MKKFIVLLCVLLIFAVFTGCRGKRTVKAVVDYGDNWQVWLASDTTARTITGYFRTEFPLGDNQSKVTIAAWRNVVPANKPMNLGVQIIEEYEPGFLYIATSDVMAENWNNTNNAFIGVYATHDFSPTQ
jgi:hypothetical protein